PEMTSATTPAAGRANSVEHTGRRRRDSAAIGGGMDVALDLRQPPSFLLLQTPNIHAGEQEQRIDRSGLQAGVVDDHGVELPEWDKGHLLVEDSVDEPHLPLHFSEVATEGLTELRVQVAVGPILEGVSRPEA